MCTNHYFEKLNCVIEESFVIEHVKEKYASYGLDECNVKENKLNDVCQH
jgi:hypothetical protein